MDNTFLDVEFHSSIDMETGFITCSVDIYLFDLTTDDRVKIGSGLLYLINTFKYEDWSIIIELTDGVSGDLYTVTDGLEAIINQEDIFFGMLAVLDHIKIDKKYRGYGYGRESIKEIINYLDILSIDYFALTPVPFEEDDEHIKKDYTQRLIKFYHLFKLKVVSDVDNTVIMGRNLNSL